MKKLNLMKKEQTVKLSDVAEILSPKPIEGELVKVLRTSDMSYPLNYDKIKVNTPTTVKLKKGDIVFPIIGKPNLYLYYEPDEIEIYAGKNYVVARYTNIQPEYLYLYLKSEVAEIIMDTLMVGGVIPHMTKRDIINLPVIQPKKSSPNYVSSFLSVIQNDRKQYLPNENAISQMMRNKEKLSDISSKDVEKKPESIEEILNMELADNVKIQNEEKLRSFLHDDVKELNACFNSKAWKATLIMAGSILEAVLIDWLSEIKGVDYFNIDYMVTDKKFGSQKRADLIDYIDKIKYIERPNWMREAEEAHEIIKKRNLVHAKLGINSSDINEEKCRRQVIVYLTDILRTRGVEEDCKAGLS